MHLKIMSFRLLELQSSTGKMWMTKREYDAQKSRLKVNEGSSLDWRELIVFKHF